MTLTVDAPPLDAKALVALAGLSSILLSGIFLNVVAWFGRRRIATPPLKALPSMEPTPWHWRDAILILATILGGQVVISWLIAGLHRVPTIRAESLERVQFAIQLTTMPILSIGVLVLIARHRQYRWGHILGASPGSMGQDLRTAGIYYIAMMPMLFVAGTLWMRGLQAIGYPVGQQQALLFMIDPEQPLWLRSQLGLVAVTAAPFTEEIIFRGILLRLSLKLTKPPAAIVIVSLLFALLHFHVASVVPLFLLAICFSVAYCRTGSLLVPIVMHATFNAVSLISQLLLKDAQHLLLP
ncbi:MAG: type II CAAX endopeptidase family protein [Verrucomicrobia bacterium]|nr:type II CAAX endopeptidase family protein [Verrucomicrobiota bacterium]